MEPYTRPQGLFAFWRYDKFPYVLGGTVTKMDAAGRVETEEYGPGSWFTPIKLLPIESGKELKAKLKELKTKLQREIDVATERNEDLLSGLFPEAIVK